MVDATQISVAEAEPPLPDTLQSPQRQTRSGRRSTAPLPEARGRGRPRKTATPAPDPDPAADSENAYKADQTVKTDIDPSPGRTTPQKRKNAPSPTPPPAVASPEAGTPAPPMSPKQSKTCGSPLADITRSSVNSPSPEDLQAAVKPIKPFDTVLEKPLDIVLKSRTVTLPAAEDPTPKSRIVLTYLILDNFKSYAGRQEVGPFHASFSSVVGPNGSGKSNVIDSLLFVFGFRASKMRQGKISALIHNSAQYPNLGYCEVEVHFQEVLDQVSLSC